MGTRDDVEADRLVSQLNVILADQSWWSLDRRDEATRHFDTVIVSAFYDGIEVGNVNAVDLRESFIPLPTPEDGYARVLLVGSTGAGKTTLLRQFIGSSHTLDRFPSTSTAKTTIADIEIVTSAVDFEAVATFMSEHEVRGLIDECLEEACKNVVRGEGDSGIAGALLEHKEQRFRLSYVLGLWQPESTAITDTQQEWEYEYEDEPSDLVTLDDNEAVDSTERTDNTRQLAEFIERIKTISGTARENILRNNKDFSEMGSANQRQDWLDNFLNDLYDNPEFSRLSLDIMDAILERFDLIELGDFERSPTGWPILWYFTEQNRDTFLRQVRWFSSNHDQQFGRLLTPLVDGIRVSGPFHPSLGSLYDDNRRLVFIDGEGLGHSAKEATSISTRVTEKFSDVEMILLVDSAQSPMSAAPLELLRSVGSSGHAHKLGVAFTHFDQVKGDNLSGYSQKLNHVKASIGNAISSLRDSLGAAVTEVLERQLADNDFYLGGLDRPTEKIPPGFISGKRGIRELLDRMQEFAEPPEPIQLAPIYSIAQLELALRDAADGFKDPWRGRLGLSYQANISKEHWGRVKALCRRIANGWDNNEYDGLRPSADLVRQLQVNISRWLDNPVSWTTSPKDQKEEQAAIDEIRRTVFTRVHTLVKERLISTHLSDWQTAYGFSGTGSSFDRAHVMGNIYDSAAPSISSAMDAWMKEFFEQVTAIIEDAVEQSGGEVLGITRESTVLSSVR